MDSSTAIAFIVAIVVAVTLASALAAVLFKSDGIVADCSSTNTKAQFANRLSSHICKSNQSISFANGDIEWKFHSSEVKLGDDLQQEEHEDKGLPNSNEHNLCKCFSPSTGYWLIKSAAVFGSWMRIGDKGLTSNVISVLKQQFPPAFSSSPESDHLASFLEHQLLSMEGKSQQNLHTCLAKLFSSTRTLASIPNLSAKYLDDYFDEVAKDKSANKQSNSILVDIASLTRSLPSFIFFSLFNLPLSDISQMQQWSDEIEKIFSISAVSSSEERESICRSAVDAMHLCEKWVEKHIKDFSRSSYDSPLFSTLLYLSNTGIIPRHSLPAHFLFLFTASYKTTAHFLTNSLAQLIHPNSNQSHLNTWRQILLQDDDAALTGSIDELIRVTPSVHTIFRVIKSPSLLADVLESLINLNQVNEFRSVAREGQFVHFSLLEIQRSPYSYLHRNNSSIPIHQSSLPLLLLSPDNSTPLMTRQRAFGVGAHSCIGKHIAYTIIKSFYLKLFTRVGSIKMEIKKKIEEIVGTKKEEKVEVVDPTLPWTEDSVYLSLKELWVKIELKT